MLLVTLVLGTTSGTQASIESTSPMVVVQTIIDRAKHLDNKAVHAKNVKDIEALVDFQKLATDALGGRASEMTPAQRAEIQDLLKKIITKTVYPEAPKFFRDVKIEYTREDKNGKRAHLTSVVAKGDKRSTVEYWLEPTEYGFRVVDLAIEGERWVENVYGQFDEIIGKYGVNGLISRMKKRVSQLSAKKSN